MRAEGGVDGTAKTPLEVPVYRPTAEEFQNFPKFIASIQEEGMKVGLARIIPPDGWTPRMSGYDNIDDMTVNTPIKQQVTGVRGVYEVLNMEARSMKVKDFKRHAGDQIKQLPEKIRDDFTEVERRYWKNVGFSCPMYGADMEGTLFDSDREIPWKVGKLGTLLDHMNMSIPGVTTTYLYFGMWKAMFAWHVEDCDLYSINYLHFGAPKAWYCVPTEYHYRLEGLARSLFPERATVCPEFLRHKTMVISPEILRKNNVPFGKTVQEAGQFMITFPLSYHAGFNHGFNCAESTNFALPHWIKYGLKARSCLCRNDTVRINFEELFKAMRESKTFWLEDEWREKLDQKDNNGKKRKASAVKTEGETNGKRTRRSGKTGPFWHFSCLCGKNEGITSLDPAYKHPKGDVIACSRCTRHNHVACYPEVRSALQALGKGRVAAEKRRKILSSFVCSMCKNGQTAQGWVFRCVCGRHEGMTNLYPKSMWPTGRLFECFRCRKWAHIDCYQHYTRLPEKKLDKEDLFCSRCDGEKDSRYWVFSCRCGKHEGATGMDSQGKQPKGRLFQCGHCDKYGHVDCYPEYKDLKKLPKRPMCHRCAVQLLPSDGESSD